MKRILSKYILCPTHVNGRPNQVLNLKYLDNPHDCDLLVLIAYAQKLPLTIMVRYPEWSEI